MAKRPSGLGKGFDALLPTNFDTSLLVADGEKIQKLALATIVPNPDQPRRHFDDEALQSLAASLKRYGVLQPLVVAPAATSGSYEIIAGERRWRAAQLAKLETVPAIVRSSKDHERLELALIENVQRVDLSPLEEAASIEHLHQQFGLSYEAIAERLSKAQSTVANTVRLLQLPKAAAEALRTSAISEGHARAILALKDTPEQQAELLQLITKQGWSVRQAERYVTSVKAGAGTAKTAKARVATETPATQALGQRLATKVHIKRTARGGRLEINFTSDDDLARILALVAD